MLPESHMCLGFHHGVCEERITPVPFEPGAEQIAPFIRIGV